MYTIDIAQQLLLYSHILVFALAMAEVLQEDWRMLRANRLDIHRLEGASQRIKWLLVLLWASGIPLVGLSIGWDLSILMERPKLMTKIIVASTLTLNGILLHLVAFPLLKGPTRHPRFSAAVVSAMGSISTVSWLYAAFVGAARLISPKMTMDLFLGLYAVMIAGGLAVALLYMRPRIERMVRAADDQEQLAADAEGSNEVAAFKAIEGAMTAISQAQNRLMAARDNVLFASNAERGATVTEINANDVVMRNSVPPHNSLPKVAAAG